MKEYKRIWRTAALVLLVVAMSGPWFFDRIYVPSPYACSAPYIRLDENFCGVPTSFGRVFFLIAGDLGNMVSELAAGTTSLRHIAPLLPYFLFTLPLISTLILILRVDQRRWRVFHIVILGITAGVTLFVFLLMLWSDNISGHYWALWGIWLYISVAASMLMLEALVIRASKKGETFDHR